MRPYLKIYIDGQEMHLPKDGANITVSYSIFDAEDLSTKGSNADRPIDFPASKINDAVFGSWYDVARDNLDKANMKDASIEVNGVPILIGKSRLVDVSTGNGFYQRNAKQYKAAFFGENGDWIQDVIGLYLSDLDWTDYVHEFNETNVVAGLDANPDSGDKYGYCIIKTKNWTYKDANGYAVTHYDCTPFLFIPAILEAIFNKYLGYSINTDFFSKQAHKRFILPCPFGSKLGAEYGKDYLDVAADHTVPTTYINSASPYPLNFDTQTYTPPLAPTNPLTVNAVGAVGTQFAGVANTTTYVCPTDGFYQISMRVKIGTAAPLPVTTTIGIYTNATVAGQGFVNVTNPALNSYLEFTEIIQASSGDWIQPAIFSVTGNTQILSGNLTINGEAVVSDGFQVDFKYLLQDWTVGDFLQGLAEVFNLKYSTNVPLKQVTIEPLDDYVYTQRVGVGGVRNIETGFLNASQDLTSKIDLKKDGLVKAISNTERTWRFIYKDDDTDETVKTLQNGGQFALYESNYVLPANRFKEAEKTIENRFFAATIHTSDASIRADNSDFIPQVPLMWNGDYTQTQDNEEAKSDFAPRLLWFGGKRGLDGNIRFYSYASSSVVDTIHSGCFAVNYNDISGYDISLAYNTFDINGFTVQGLAERFFTKFMSRKRAGKIVEEWIYYKTIDILNLSFRNKVVLNGNAFILQSIEEYNPIINDSTKVVLEYDQIDQQEDYDAFLNSSISGVYTTYIV
jgi:hypothetical protein